jgi:hypothetical protein
MQSTVLRSQILHIYTRSINDNQQKIITFNVPMNRTHASCENSRGNQVLRPCESRKHINSSKRSQHFDVAIVEAMILYMISSSLLKQH